MIESIDQQTGEESTSESDVDLGDDPDPKRRKLHPAPAFSAPISNPSSSSSSSFNSSFSSSSSSSSAASTASASSDSHGSFVDALQSVNLPWAHWIPGAVAESDAENECAEDNEDAIEQQRVSILGFVAAAAKVLFFPAFKRTHAFSL